MPATPTYQELVDLINLYILSGGRRTLAVNLREVLDKISQAATSNPEPPDLSPYFKHNGEVPATGPWNLAGNNLNGVNEIKSDDYSAINLPDRIFFDGFGNVIFDLKNRSLGLKLTTNGSYAALFTNNLSVDRNIFFQDKDYTGVADKSDIDDLKDGVPSGGDTLNKLYNLIIGQGQFVGGFDASGGTVPTTGSGASGAIDKGDFWKITNAGTISGIGALKAGDVLFASVAGASSASDFFAVENNQDQATSSTLGLVKLYNNLSASNTDGSVTQSVLVSEFGKYLDQSGSKIFATASGTDTYSLILTPAITGYSSGQVFNVKFTNANTTTSTININGLGAKAIKKNVNDDLGASDIRANGVYTIFYDGTNFQLLTGSDYSVLANGFINNTAKVLSFNPKGFLKYPYYFDDFISGSAPNGNWVSSGAGLTITINNAPGKVGAFGIGTGSVSNGQRAYSLDSLKVVPNAFAFEVTYKIEIINLSTATEEYNCWFGFGDSKPAEGSNEIIFLYKRSASGNFWVTKTTAGGVATTNVSSTAVTASVYYLKMEVNQAMNQVVFKIASGNNGTYSTIATHTTNIPTTGVYPIFSIMGEASSGGTNRLFHIDAFEFESSDGGRTIS